MQISPLIMHIYRYEVQTAINQMKFYPSHILEIKIVIIRFARVATPNIKCSPNFSIHKINVKENHAERRLLLSTLLRVQNLSV